MFRRSVHSRSLKTFIGSGSTPDPSGFGSRVASKVEATRSAVGSGTRLPSGWNPRILDRTSPNHPKSKGSKQAISRIDLRWVVSKTTPRHDEWDWRIENLHWGGARGVSRHI